MTILEKKRFQILLFVVGVIVLSITAEKCRHMVGEEAASKSGQFTLLNCFDGSSGTLACLVKEGVKLYTYSIRSLHVESRRNTAIETALADAVAQGMSPKDAAKVAQKEGAKAAKLATRKVKRIIGPIISSGWDFFEALYFGGTMTEGFLRGTGTLFGTYGGGFIGEERFGRFGYLVGSQLGSWVGGRIGLMVYDVVNGVHYLLQFTQDAETEVFDNATANNIGESKNLETSEVAEESYITEPTWSSPSYESNNNYVETSEVAADSYTNEPTWNSPSDYSNSNNPETSEVAEDSYTNEPTWDSPPDESNNDNPETSEVAEDSYVNEPTWDSPSNNYESYADESFDVRDEL